MNIVHEMYTSTFFKIYTVWKREHKTMRESGHVLREIEDLAKKKPMEILNGLRKHLSDKQSASAVKKGEGPVTSFVGIQDIKVEEGEGS